MGLVNYKQLKMPVPQLNVDRKVLWEGSAGTAGVVLQLKDNVNSYDYIVAYIAASSADIVMDSAMIRPDKEQFMHLSWGSSGGAMSVTALLQFQGNTATLQAINSPSSMPGFISRIEGIKLAAPSGETIPPVSAGVYANTATLWSGTWGTIPAAGSEITLLDDVSNYDEVILCSSGSYVATRALQQ